MRLVVLCPTRGRVAAARETLQTFLETKELEYTQLLFVVNDNEEELYPNLPTLVVPERPWMNEVLQQAADSVLARQDVDAIGFIGDDNRFRTPGWDRWVGDVLESNGGGFVYANDLMQGPNLPCHIFVSAGIPKALGYFGLRGLQHMYIDNAWLTLGEGAGCLYYMSHIIIEHMHPLVGKAKWDDSYRESNAEPVFAHDQKRFMEWRDTELTGDVEIVRKAIGQ